MFGFVKGLGGALRRGLSLAAIAFLPLAFVPQTPLADEAFEYRTGFEEEILLSVSPDGRRLAILGGTGKQERGLEMRIMDVATGGAIQVTEEPGRRYYDLAPKAWSPDGRYLAVISALTKIENKTHFYSMRDLQIRVLDTKTWSGRTLTAGEGVRGKPIFSADGKTVYYVRGRERERGATVAAWVDLYAIPVDGGGEQRLTHEEAYQMHLGDDDGKTILFSAYGMKNFPFVPWGTSYHANMPNDELYTYDISKRVVRPLPIDRAIGVDGFTKPLRDGAGNLYFKTRFYSEPGPYRYFLARSNLEGKEVAEMSGSSMEPESRFTISSSDGVIYFSKKIGGEWVVRRLEQRAVR